MNDFQAITDDFAASEAKRAKEVQGHIHRLKAALIAPLLGGAIARVVVRFDGCGDSGAVDECLFFDAGGQPVSYPEMMIGLAGEGGEISLAAALEKLTYLALECHHPGWEVDDGACGELVIDVATPSFVLDCQLRYTDDHSTDL